MEFKEYAYTLNGENSLSNEQERIVQDVLNTFGNMSAEQLEILATTYFIYRQQNSLFGMVDKEMVLDKVRRAKSSRFTEEQIVNSYRKMEEICFPLTEKYIS